jgi:hypothetical protein
MPHGGAYTPHARVCNKILEATRAVLQSDRPHYDPPPSCGPEWESDNAKVRCHCNHRLAGVGCVEGYYRSGSDFRKDGEAVAW